MQQSIVEWLLSLVNEWHRMPLGRQLLHAGTALSLCSFAILFWTPFGNRSAALKSLILAIFFHVLAWQFVEQYPISRAPIESRPVHRRPMQFASLERERSRRERPNELLPLKDSRAARPRPEETVANRPVPLSPTEMPRSPPNEIDVEPVIPRTVVPLPQPITDSNSAKLEQPEEPRTAPLKQPAALPAVSSPAAEPALRRSPSESIERSTDLSAGGVEVSRPRASVTPESAQARPDLRRSRPSANVALAAPEAPHLAQIAAPQSPLMTDPLQVPADHPPPAPSRLEPAIMPGEPATATVVRPRDPPPTTGKQPVRRRAETTGTVRETAALDRLRQGISAAKKEVAFNFEIPDRAAAAPPSATSAPVGPLLSPIEPSVTQSPSLSSGSRPNISGNADQSSMERRRLLADEPSVTRPRLDSGASAGLSGPTSRRGPSEDSIRRSPQIAADETGGVAGQMPTAATLASRGNTESPDPSALIFDRGVQPLDDPNDIWKNRTSRRRMDITLQYGGSSETEQAVANALEWLAVHQAADGHWEAVGFTRQCPANDQCLGHASEKSFEQGLTALSLLAFLGAGHTHLESDRYRTEVARGVNYLLRTQRQDGDLRDTGRIYDHAIATLVLTEAYAMSHDETLRQPAQSAVIWLAQAQNDTTGGWRYGPGQDGDTSVFGWVMLALRSAKRAGLTVPPGTWERAGRWLPSVSSGRSGGLAAYRPDERPSYAMTAEALVCRQIFEVERGHRSLDEAQEFILGRLPAVDDPALYYWYYGTLAMFQFGGPQWRRWNQQLTTTLLATQEKTGHRKGSWDPRPDPVGQHGGRIFTTATSALCLEVYYRYLPLYAGRATDGVPVRDR